MIIIKQLRVGIMATFCYIVGDEETMECALIDPAFETNRILREVDKVGLNVTSVINTHGHFDHIFGNSKIIKATKAKLYIHELDAALLRKGWIQPITRLMIRRNPSAPDQLLKDGDLVAIGNETLKVIHTPGHTRGGISLYTPGHVFTGDTLFINAVGRTDLKGGSLTELIKSIKDKLYCLPDHTIVWPGHDYDSSPNSTIGQEKKNNPITR